MHVSRLVTRRSTVAGVAIAAVVAVTAPAGATTTTTPSHGRATSILTILQLHIAGQTVTAGRISAVAANDASPHVAKLVVTPLDSTATGPLGQCTVAASGTTCAGGQSIPATPKSITLPNNLGSVVGPTFVAQAKDTAAGVLATVKLSALGKVTLAGVPLNLRLASLSDLAQVVSGNATAKKSFSLGDLSLPSLTDLLASLGLDLGKTLDQLTQGKLTQLAGLVTTTTSGAVKAANDAVDTAQQAVIDAGATVPSTLATASAQLTTATQDATTANGAFDTAWSSAYGALPVAVKGVLDTALTTAGLSGATMTASQFDNADPTLVAALQAAFGATETTLATLASAATAADAVVAAVNALVDALQNLVDTVLSKVNADGDPLAALGALKVGTSAIAASTPKAVAGVSIGSIDVLGQTASLSTLTGAVNAAGATLSSVLNSVPGVTFTPPSIALGTPSKSTHTQGRTRFASASVKGLTVTLPTLDLAGAGLPLALPGGVTSSPGSLVVGNLSETAQWTPSSSATSGSPVPAAGGGPTLSETGGNVLLPILATVLLGMAAAIRRRTVRA